VRRLLQEITIPNYITHVMLSKKRKIVYYNIKGKRKPPQKYLKDKLYIIDNKGFLRYRPTGEFVVANKRTAGTPKYQKINGQDFYSGFGSPFIRNTMVTEIKRSLLPYAKRVPKIVEFPIQFEMELYTTIDEGNWDLDNLWIYSKCFQDVLVQAGIIPDDNIQFITKPAAPEFFPVKTPEERKIIFKIYKDERNIKITEPIRK
jgi:hypothetical protein